MLGQTHQLQHRGHALGDIGRGHFAHAQAEGDVVAHGHVREQRVALEHHAQAATAGFGVGDVAAIQHDAPGRGVDETGDHLQGGGLAATGRAEQRNEFAFFHRQICGDDGVDCAIAFAKAFELEKSHVCVPPVFIVRVETRFFVMGRCEGILRVRWRSI